MLGALKTPSPPSSPKSVYDHGSPSVEGHKFVWRPEDVQAQAQDNLPPPKPFVPSLTTVEKSVATKVYLENHYYGILKRPRDRDQRRMMLEEELGRLGLPESEKENVRRAWALSETEHLRDMRKRVSNNSFTTLKVIGHGAFGVVTLVREKPTGELYAMKQLRKADMLRKGQEGHVRAERDLMTAASTTSRWIVRLVYSFQDVDHLYLVMEFMGGGDLLNLLIERDIFDEKFAHFYVAEMVLAVQEAHRLGYIHRDIKPDNFLFDLKGHIKISDFGLATDFHWAHDGAYYDQQRRHLLHKHGIDLEDTQPPGAATRRYNNRDLYAATLPGEDQPGSVLTWRDKNRRKLAYSVVGTNNYMSVEVLRGTGYDQSCDWWSLGVIIYEMLYGFPPFISKSRHITRQKIMNWRQSLRFPPSPKISRKAQDLIEKLICEREDRLGYKGATSSSRPNSMIINQRRSGFINASGGPAPGGMDFGLRDGAEDIKAHPWFKGIDFATIHLETPPFVPELKDPTDTRYFEDDIDANPLPAPDANPNADPRDQTKDPMLKDRTHGQHLLEVRKQLAFQGFTFKRPKKSVYDPRNGVIDIKDMGGEKEKGKAFSRLLAPDGSRLRSMSL
ncbi:kinase-like protein [Atractiella rhizophila]|nr:kinase-like protein [Atractiella rhizophila]